MAINLATKYSSKVDEVFRRQSLTDALVNNGRYDFVGARTVKVYSMGVAPMNDYQAEGANRYGTPVELDDMTEELTLTQRRSFTFTIDATNAIDSPEGVRNAAAALRRQLDNVVIPEVDTYRLKIAAEKSGLTNYGEIDEADAYYAFISANAELTDKEVPIEGRIAFVSPYFATLIKQDRNFVKASNLAQEMLIKGEIGEIDGVKLILSPSARLPKGVSFFIMHNSVMTAPTKLAEYKIHENPPGIAGHLVEGLVYYDAFITNNKKVGASVHFGELGNIKFTMTGTASGKGKVRLTERNVAGKLMYKLVASGSTISKPELGDAVTGWTEVPANGEITATAGQKIMLISVLEGVVNSASDEMAVTVGG